MSDNTEWRSIPSSEGHARRSSTSPQTRTMADLLFLPEIERSLMNWLLRQQQATLAEIASHLNQAESATQTLLNELMTQGFVREIEQNHICCYQPTLVSRKGRNVPTNIWDALE